VDQRSHHGRHRRRCLDPRTTLANQPPEPLVIRFFTENRDAIRAKGPQDGPSAPHTSQRQSRRRLQSVERECDIDPRPEHRTARSGWRQRVKSADHPTPVEVVSPGDIHHEWPRVVDIGDLRKTHRAPPGLEGERRNTRPDGHDISPRSISVHNNGRANDVFASEDFPCPVETAQTQRRGRCDDGALRCTGVGGARLAASRPYRSTARPVQTLHRQRWRRVGSEVRWPRHRSGRDGKPTD
jgi:hypothetical protein